MKMPRFKFRDTVWDYLGGIAVVVLMVYYAPLFGPPGRWVGISMAFVGLFTIPCGLLAIWEIINESLDRRRSSRAQGFALVELVLILGVLAALAALAFMLYPKVAANVRAENDKQALRGMFANLQSFVHSSGNNGGSFNSDPDSYAGDLESNPAALASLLKPLDCRVPNGGNFVSCRLASAEFGSIYFGSVGTCYDPPTCWDRRAPYNVFAMRVSLDNVSVDSCLALVQGLGNFSSGTGASAIYTFDPDYNYSALFITATVADRVAACQSRTGTMLNLTFDFWPWGDGFGFYPGYGN